MSRTLAAFGGGVIGGVLGGAATMAAFIVFGAVLTQRLRDRERATPTARWSR